MKTRIIGIVLLVSLLLTGFFLLNGKKHEIKTVIKNKDEILVEKDLKSLSPDVYKAVTSKENIQVIFQKEFKSNGDYKFHHERGEKLYQLAFANGMYSDNKLKVLQLAKLHLVRAKNLKEVANEN